MSSLVPRHPLFFALQLAFSIIHRSGRHSAFPLPCIILNANRRTKKCGRPGNEATLCLWTERQQCTNWKLVKLPFLKTRTKLSIAMHSLPRPQATPRFYLAAMEKNREKAWDQNCITDRKWWTRLVRRDAVLIPGLLLIFLHGCEIKTGSGLEMRLMHSHISLTYL